MKKLIRILAGLIALVLLLVLVLIGYINYFDSPGFSPVDVSSRINVQEADMELGEKLVQNNCTICHLSENGSLSGRVIMNQKQWGKIASANLTRHPDSPLSLYSNSELFLLLKSGLKRDGKMALPMMPKISTMSDKDILSIILFLQTENELTQPTPTTREPGELTFFVKALMKFAIKPVEILPEKILVPDETDLVAFGKYLVNGRYLCYQCHSRSTEKINYLHPELSLGYMGGGARHMVFGNNMGIRAANLTPDIETGIGSWQYKGFENVFLKKVRPDGMPIRPPMSLIDLDSVEIAAIWEYLQTIPSLNSSWPYDSRIEID